MVTILRTPVYELGQNWFESFLPAACLEETRAVFKHLMDGEIERFEYHENPVLTKAGEERLIAWHNTVLTDQKGHIIATLSSGKELEARDELLKHLLITKPCTPPSTPTRKFHKKT